MAVEIVPIKQEHIEGFHRALDFVARERRYLAFLKAPPPESIRAFVLNNIAQGYPQLVVLSAGEVVGWCDVLPKSGPVHAHVGVLGVALLPEFRGQGLGGRLLRQTLDAARTFGLHRIELTVRQDNRSAIALYRKIGFEIEGLMRDAIKVDDVCENVVLMALLL
jgi:ribosomal protein S18 acetylase RimI-like enzyme